MQQAILGTSIIPVDGSVTDSKLAPNLTLTGGVNISGNIRVNEIIMTNTATTNTATIIYNSSNNSIDFVFN
jgi:hypothetical protein